MNDEASDAQSRPLLRSVEAAPSGPFEDLLTDSGLRSRMIELMDIGALLDGCVIAPTYRVPDELAHSVVLSPLGEEIVGGLAEKRRRLKPNDLRLSAFLSLACPAGFLIEPSTDPAALRQAISEEIGARRILYPFIYGREFHDLAVERFPLKTRFDVRNSVELLNNLPIGVFQVGFTTVGPLGCLESTQRRQLIPNRSSPGYLCEDATCSGIHPFSLKTADSSISKARSAMRAYVSEAHPPTAAERDGRHLREAVALEYQVFSRHDSEALFDTISDSLEEGELRHLVVTYIHRALANSDTRPRMAQVLAIEPNGVQRWADERCHAELLQVLLLLDDTEVAGAIDAAVDRGGIVVGESEVRSQEVTRHDSVEKVEIGSYGVRWTGPSPQGYVARRLYELLHHVYFASGQLDSDDLTHHLSLPSGLSESDLLGEAVSSYSAAQIVEKAIAENRRSLEAAETFLGILTPDADRSERCKRILWKIGLKLDVKYRDLEQTDDRLEDLRQSLIAGAEEKVLRGEISNVFAELETALQVGLIFTTWALTTDHFVATAPFVYDSRLTPKVFDFIDQHLPVAPDFELQRDGKNTLAPLGSGYARLAAALSGLEVASFTRPKSDWPAECRAHFRPFAFKSTIPFLNLTQSAREQICADLASVSSFVQDPLVLRVRNSGIHGNSEFPTVGEIESVVRRFGDFRMSLWQSGFYPRSYGLQQVAFDSMGRQSMSYRSGEDTVTLRTPTWTVCPKLPLGSDQLVVMPKAEIGGCGPLRFEIEPLPGRRSYWDGWPVRFESKDSVVSNKPAIKQDSSVPLAS
jgi:hypothetical protein